MNTSGWSKTALAKYRYGLHQEFSKANPNTKYAKGASGFLFTLTFLWYLLTWVEIIYYLLALDKLLFTEYHAVRGMGEPQLKTTDELRDYVSRLKQSDFT